MIRSILILAAAGSSSAFSPAARSPSSSTRLRLHDVEASVGSASWAGARFGDEFLAAGYEAQCTHGHSSANSMDGSRAMPTGGHGYSRTETHERSKSLHAPTWVAGSHAEGGNSDFEWAGARYGDYAPISRSAAPTPSTWLE